MTPSGMSDRPSPQIAGEDGAEMGPTIVEPAARPEQDSNLRPTP